MAKQFRFSDKNKLIIPLASTAVLSILAFILSLGTQPKATVSKAATPTKAPVQVVVPSPKVSPKPTPKVTPTPKMPVKTTPPTGYVKLSN